MASAASAAAAGPGTLKLKFIFANHDGVVVEHETEPTTLIKDLKVALVGRWPSGKVCCCCCCLFSSEYPLSVCANL